MARAMITAFLGTVLPHVIIAFDQIRNAHRIPTVLPHGAIAFDLILPHT